MEQIITATPNMKYFIKINKGRVRELVDRNTIREMKTDIFAVHHSEMFQSEFVSMEENTSITFFDISEMDKFFLKNPILGKKFYQNLCKIIFFFIFFFFHFFIFFIFIYLIFFFQV